jgi:hypothetical protein
MIRKMLLWSAASSCFFLPAFSQDTNSSIQYNHNGETYYGIPEDPNDLEENTNYISPTIISNDPADWEANTGCLEASAENNGDGIWAQTTGGQCANIGTNGAGAIRFGYVNTVVSNTWDVLSGVFEEIGLNVFGYRYSWYVKNYNANDTSPNQTGAQDPLKVRVIVKDSSGNNLFSKEYDYSESISTWVPDSGFEFFDATTDIGSVTLEVEGYDAGYWAGWWGPEFREAELNMLFYYKDPDDKCDTDPLSSPTCPGYADALYAEQEAMLALINDSKEEEFFGEDKDKAFVEEVSKSVEESVKAEEPKVEEIIVEEIKPVEEPVEVVVEELPVEELKEEIIEEPVEEVIEETVTPNVNALSVAQSAVSAADSLTQDLQNQTLSATSQSVEDANSIFESNVDLANNSITQGQNLDMGQGSNQLESSMSGTTNLEMMATGTDTGFDNSGNVNISSLLNTQNEINTNVQNVTGVPEDTSVVTIEITVDTFELASLDTSIEAAFAQAFNDRSEIKEPEQSIEEQNAEEDELVEKALSGDDGEDAQAALLGYNPNFRAYQQPQMPDSQFYQPKEIYEGQKNYDNPNSRFFNGASDELHNQMVRQQYDR